jgi:hypothetical protein
LADPVVVERAGFWLHDGSHPCWELHLMSTRSLFLRLGLTLSLLLAACGGSGGDDNPGDDNPPGDDDPPACADLAGSWDTDGACGSDLCTITQNGCAITQVDCSSGAHSTSGSINGNQFSYTGVSGAGVPATCTGTASGDAITGTCTNAAGSCAFSGDRL